MKYLIEQGKVAFLSIFESYILWLLGWFKYLKWTDALPEIVNYRVDVLKLSLETLLKNS